MQSAVSQNQTVGLAPERSHQCSPEPYHSITQCPLRAEGNGSVGTTLPLCLCPDSRVCEQDTHLNKGSSRPVGVSQGRNALSRLHRSTWREARLPWDRSHLSQAHPSDVQAPGTGTELEVPYPLLLASVTLPSPDPQAPVSVCVCARVCGGDVSRHS